MSEFLGKPLSADQDPGGLLLLCVWTSGQGQITRTAVWRWEWTWLRPSRTLFFTSFSISISLFLINTFFIKTHACATCADWCERSQEWMWTCVWEYIAAVCTAGCSAYANGSLMSGPTMSHWPTRWRREVKQGKSEHHPSKMWSVISFIFKVGCNKCRDLC